MDILIHMRETKIVASGTLLRLNYYKNTFVGPGSTHRPIPRWKLNYHLLALVELHNSRQEKNGKEK